MSAEQYEASAREIGVSGLQLYGRDLLRLIPKSKHHLLEEVVTGVAHDAIEFGEAVVGLEDNAPSPLEHYLRGYVDAISDTDKAQKKET